MKLNLLKNVVSIIAVFLAIAHTHVIYGQDTIHIASGQANAGLLETTINGDVDAEGNRIHPNRVYKLDEGFHFVFSAINATNDGGTIRIVGATGGKKPVIIPLVNNGVAPGENRITSSLELKNLHIQGRNDEGGRWGGYIFRLLGNDRSLFVEDCIIEFAERGFMLQDVPQGLTMEFRNNYFRDFFVQGQQWAGNVFDAKEVPLESLIFENNTVSGGGVSLLIQSQFVRYALINHNTFINNSTFVNLNPYFYEAYITNNMFYNCNVMGEDFNYISANPDGVRFGIIALDTLDIKIGTNAIPAYAMNAGQTALVAPYDNIDNYKIYVADNIHFIDSTKMGPYWKGEYNTVADNPVSYLSWFGIQGPHDVNVPPVWMGQREMDLFTNHTGIVAENNILNQDPQLATEALSEADAEQLAIWLRLRYEVPDEARTPDMSGYVFGDFDPTTIPGIETEDGDGVTKISDMIEDFSYSANFNSSIDGYRIGALHWTNEIDNYDANQALMDIITSYEAAITPSVADTLYIASGQANAGLLETTINGDVDAEGNRIHPNRVYKLDEGFHFVFSAINATNDGGTIRIVGATGGKKPVIIPLVNNGVAPGENRITSSLELKNLHIQGRNDEGGRWGGYIFRLLGNDRSLFVEDCIIEFAERGFMLQDVPRGLTMEFRNNYFRDFFVQGQQWAGNVFDAKEVPLESLIFENNTVSGGGVSLLIQSQFVRYALINHNTFINNSTFVNLNPYFYEAYITNNMFYNCNVMGEDFNYISANPDGVRFGIIALDTLDIKIGTNAIPAYAMNAGQTALVAPYDNIDNYKIYVADNIHFIDSTKMGPYWKGEYNTVADNPVSYLSWFGIQGPHDVNVPPVWMGEREIDLFANHAGIVEENNILNQDPQLATEALSEADAEQLAIWLRLRYEVPDEARTPDMSGYVFGDFDPTTIPGIETEDGDGVTKISDMIEDFSYSANFNSSIDGYRIGALHWTNEIEDYDANQALMDIITSYEAAITPSVADTLYIASGQANAGLLETTINGDVDAEGNRIHPNRVYKLDEGFHFVFSAINATNDGGTIRIVGATGGKKPVIIPLVNNGVAPGENRITSSLELKNLHIQGRNDEGGRWGGYIFRLLGNDRSLFVEDCIIEFAERGFMLQDVPRGLTMEFRNNYFRDFFVQGQQWAGNVFDAKEVPLESLIFENNTVSGGGVSLLIQSQFVRYALINHNTFINNSTFVNLNPYFYEAYITNNMFYNCNVMGEDFNYISANPDGVRFGIIALDTLDIKIGTNAIPAYAMNAGQTALVAPYDNIDNYKIYVADNIHFIDSTKMGPYWKGEYNTVADNPVSYLSWFGIQGPHDVNVPPVWMGQREMDLFTNHTGIVEENNVLNQDPQLATEALSEADAEQLAIWLRLRYEVPDEARTPDMSGYVFGDFDPTTIPGIETEDGDGITRISDMIEDFSYSANFNSSIDGYRIGALHWTNEIEDYDANQALMDIITSYEAAITPSVADTLYIASGQANAGLLETTINGDVDAEGNRIHPNRVYKLDEGFHFVFSAINATNDGGTIRIVGATGGKKPVIIPLVNNGVAPGENRITSSLELKNLHIQGRNDEGGRWGGYIFRLLGNDRSLFVEDCIIEFAERGFMLQDVPRGLTMEFRNNYFRDFFVQGQQWAGNVFDAKEVPLESLIFENNTVSGGGVSLLIQSQFVRYALINHNTFINNSTFVNLNPYFYEAYITNNMFYNCNVMGEDFNYISANPDGVRFGIIALDTLDIKIGTNAIPAYAMNAGQTALVAPYDNIDNYKIYVADNIHFIDSTKMGPYWKGEYNTVADNPVSYLSWFGIQGPHDVNVPPVWMGEREIDLFANHAGIVEENNILNQDPQLATEALSEADAEQLAIWLRLRYEVPDEARTPDMSGYVFGDFDPTTIPGIETEDGDGITRISDMIEDFSYSANFKSSIDGYRIGALHWTNEIDNYDANQAFMDIITSYEAALATSVEDLTIVADATSLYPNPARETTIVNFELIESSHVILDVYDLHGKKIDSILNQKLSKGQHTINWNVSSIASGIYIVTFQAGKYRTSKKLVVTQ